MLLLVHIASGGVYKKLVWSSKFRTYGRVEVNQEGVDSPSDYHLAKYERQLVRGIVEVEAGA